MSHQINLNEKELHLIKVLIKYTELVPEINADVREMSKIQDYEAVKRKLELKLKGVN